MEFREFVTRDKKRAWKAKKRDIIKFWQSLNPALPLRVSPIPKEHEGTRFDSDGLRITGSPQFINSILSKLKDFLSYEKSPGLSLDVEYRQIESKDDKQNSRPVYVCYIHILEKE